MRQTILGVTRDFAGREVLNKWIGMVYYRFMEGVIAGNNRAKTT